MSLLATRMSIPAFRRPAGAVCLRAYATATAPPSSSSNIPSTPPPPRRQPLEPTTFDGKAAPRDVHMRPGLRRGLPGANAIVKPWEKEQKERLEAQRKMLKAQGNDPRAIHSMDDPQTFDGPSKPRAVYTRPNRELPVFKNRIPMYIALALAGVGAWGLFVLYATNSERLSSSVLRQITFQLRNSSDVVGVLGNGVRLEPNFFGGDPFIHGGINLMQGRIDLKFRVQGSKDSGTLYFTSIRPTASSPWRIVRYKLVADSGEVLRLEDKFLRSPTPDGEPADASAVPAAATNDSALAA